MHTAQQIDTVAAANIQPIQQAGHMLPAGYREDKADLDEGPATLTLPEMLSAESVADFEHWINGIIKKARRRAGIKQEKPIE